MEGAVMRIDREGRDVTDLPGLWSDEDAEVRAMSDDKEQLIDYVQKENAALREALKQAQKFWLSLGYTTRHFSEIVKVSATQLSAWTDEIPDREPDFKD